MTAAPPDPLVLDRIATPIGEALVVTDRAGCLRAFDFHDYEPRMRRLLRRHCGAVPLEAGRAPAGVRAAVDAYFAGELEAFTGVWRRTGGTDFQRRVWAALLDIPAGCTESYGRLAVRIGAPSAVRAVGLANGANPLGVIVPCHRVVGANGALTGYGGGLERKRWLLAHEARHTRRLAA